MYIPTCAHIQLYTRLQQVRRVSSFAEACGYCLHSAWTWFAMKPHIALISPPCNPYEIPDKIFYLAPISPHLYEDQGHGQGLFEEKS